MSVAASKRFFRNYRAALYDLDAPTLPRMLAEKLAPDCAIRLPHPIGTNRRMSGFRNWHQIPLLKSLPDRLADRECGGFCCYFADGDYVAYCGWPALRATVSGDGWMGIAPSNQPITMASLDLWRCENGLLRENWVMIDILDVWRQLGVDVLERMREVSFDRQPRDFQS